MSSWKVQGFARFLQMRISCLVVRLGESIHRIYFSVIEGNKGFGFKATGLSSSWAGCLMDYI